MQMYSRDQLQNGGFGLGNEGDDDDDDNYDDDNDDQVIALVWSCNRPNCLLWLTFALVFVSSAILIDGWAVM